LARVSPSPLHSPNGLTRPPAWPARPVSGWPSRVKTLAWRLFISLLIMLTIGEIGLRIVGLGYPYESEPDSYVAVADPDVLFAPRPGFRGFSEGTQVAISAQGLRDREYGSTAPANTTRLLILGDSVTFGAGVLAAETFSKQLETRLNASGNGRTFEVVNTGVIGYNTIQERARLEQIGLGLQPDLVVLTFVVNDLLNTFSIFDHQYDPVGPLAPVKQWLRRNSRLYRFYQNVSWRLIDAIRKDPNRPEMPRDHQRVVERQAEIVRIAQLSPDHGAAFLLMLYPDNLYQQVSPDPSGHSETVRENFVEFARANGLPLLDLTDALGDVRDPRARTMRLREDPHPSPTGHQAIAEALFDTLFAQGLLAP
jgi:lysophospholipase L1-like esterase